MDISANQIITEILDLKSQYQIEVGSRRKPWPKSIKDRVLKLVDLGLMPGEITEAINIPYHTLHRWGIRSRNRKKNKFHSLTVTDQVFKEVQPRTVTVKDCTVKVSTPDGYQIEISDLKAAAIIIQYLRKGQ